MKKNILILFSLLFAKVLFAQIVTTTPSFVTSQAGAITIVYDASQGSAGLKDFAGPIYAHTGVITNLSTGSSDWKHVITAWPSSTNQSTVNIAKNTLTSLGNNKWQLVITPDIYSYYGITDQTEIVKQLSFVFRNADGSKTGKNADGSDIFVMVYQPGLNIQMAAPTKNSVITSGSTVTLTANASQPCNIKLYLNSTLLTSGSSVATLSNSYTFNTAGNYNIIAEATLSGVTKRDTSYVCVAKTQVTATRPTGLKDGVTINSDGSVTFCLAVPGLARTNVFLLGDFNNFQPNNDYMMNLQVEQASENVYGFKTNYYWLTLSGLNPTTEYAFQYLVDGTLRIGDAYCEKILDPWNDKWINQYYSIYPNLRTYPADKAQDVLSTFQINPTKYQWQTSSFTAPAQNKLMIYELLFRDFTPEGSVNAAILKLDYLKSLGINAIELMPIMEFDGNDSWGYNPNFYFAPDKAYGTKLDYQRFVDECHKRGIAVILDVVFNHTYGLSPMCKLWWDATNSRPATTNPYYNAIAPHPYSVGNDLNHSRAFVRGWLKRALQFWLTEYKVDGYRFDLSKGFTQTASTEATVSNYDASRIGYIKEYSDAIKAVNSNGYVILEHFCNTDEEDALAAYNGTMLWRKMVDPYEQAAMGWSTNSDFSGMVGTNRVGYPESHDEERLAYKTVAFGQTALKDTVTCMKQLAAVGAFAYLNPGPRMMWQFGELGYSYTIDYNGRTGKKPVRWDYLNIPERKGLYDAYSKFLTFRNQYGDLFSSPTSWNWQVSSTDWSAGKRIFLQNSSLTAIILGNFTGTGSVTATPNFTKTGIWYNLMDGSQLNVSNTSMTVNLQLGELAIYTDKQISLANAVNAPQADYNCKVFPTSTTSKVYINSPNAIKNALIYNMQGVQMKSVLNTNEVDFSALNSGLYILEVNTSGGRSIHKIVKE